MEALLRYFDLNTRITTAYIKANPHEALEFAKPVTLPSIPLWKQLLLYLGTIIGVLFSSSIMQFQTNQDIQLHITLPAIVLSAIIAIVILPGIYEKVINPISPFIVQFGLFVQQGVFWSVLLTAVGKAIGAH
ncbi:hypothetical protein [Ktedonobacter racemifer]|uniref:Uncharacterized protein n=1 Tax=Ktedonobacter racemifer DSM 44963 TaxID=485913 RepID=D6TH07_KTERA|nr:hypothetical protein [Ktedonobacter racemifer]EFH88936.1 hypothetical protein Krac_10452 [Ktedonobacter racemifer DSM 44963]